MTANPFWRRANKGLKRDLFGTKNADKVRVEKNKERSRQNKYKVEYYGDLTENFKRLFEQN